MPVFPGLVPSDIYLPAAHVDLFKWAVVACDQFTSQREYWQNVEKEVGDAPSTLRMILPEIYLNEASASIPGIHNSMRKYLKTGVVEKKVENGFVLTERTTESGVRLGLIAAIDLNAYDYAPGAKPLIRALTILRCSSGIDSWETRYMIVAAKILKMRTSTAIPEGMDRKDLSIWSSTTPCMMNWKSCSPPKLSDICCMRIISDPRQCSSTGNTCQLIKCQILISYQ